MSIVHGMLVLDQLSIKDEIVLYYWLLRRVLGIFELLVPLNFLLSLRNILHGSILVDDLSRLTSSYYG